MSMIVHRAGVVAASAVLILTAGCGETIAPTTETTPVETGPGNGTPDGSGTATPDGSGSPEKTGGGGGTPTSTQTESPESTQTGQSTGGTDDDTLPPESSLP